MKRFEVVARTERSGWPESVHYGAAVGLARDGSVEVGIGDVNQPVYGRSCNKPVQAAAMVRLGLDVPLPLLALVCASHSGCAEHIHGVRRLLALAGASDADLANTPDLPLDAGAADRLLSEGGQPASIYQNCSGKHAGMIATCVGAGWDYRGGAYLRTDHPLQRIIGETFEELTGEVPSHVGIDGCGAPAHVVSLVGLARAVRAIVTGAAGSATEVVADAMRSYPELVGGPRRDVTGFMQGVPGLVAKDGAEGTYVAAMPDGRAVALKIADGSGRARPVVLAAVLAALGVELPTDTSIWQIPVMGHGHPVGAVVADGAIAGFIS